MWWARVNVAVWAVWSGYGEGHLVVTGECGGMSWMCGCGKRQLVGTVECASMGCMERYVGDVWCELVNVLLWAVSRCYGEGHLAETGEYGGLALLERHEERICLALVYVAVWSVTSGYRH